MSCIPSLPWEKKAEKNDFLKDLPTHFFFFHVGLPTKEGAQLENTPACMHCCGLPLGSWSRGLTPTRAASGSPILTGKQTVKIPLCCSCLEEDRPALRNFGALPPFIWFKPPCLNASLCISGFETSQQHRSYWLPYQLEQTLGTWMTQCCPQTCFLLKRLSATCKKLFRVQNLSAWNWQQVKHAQLTHPFATYIVFFRGEHPYQPLFWHVSKIWECVGLHT